MRLARMLSTCFICVVLLPSLGSAQGLTERTVQLGELVGGTLEESDGIEPHNGRRADRFLFQATAGQRIEVIARSEDFDTYLAVEDTSGLVLAEDDDGGGDLNSRVTWTVSLDGQYGALVSSYDEGLGEYEVMVRILNVQPIAYSPLRFGRSVRGALTDSDGVRSDDRYVDGFDFEGESGARIELSLTSDEFDPYLILLAPTGEVLAENDDSSSDDDDSQVAVRLPSDGVYRVLVTSYITGEGAYRINLERRVPTPIRNQPIDFGDAVDGEFTEADGTWSVRGTYADGYVFDGEAGQTIEVTMSSSELDSYLVVLGPEGDIIGENDDYGSRLDSRLTVRLPSAGSYRAIATTYSSAVGDYELTLAALLPELVEADEVSYGATIEGALGESDPERQSASGRVDTYRVEGAAGERLLVAMRSDVINSLLWLVGPTGEVLARDDDSGGGRDAFLELVLPYSGTYLISAASTGGEFGHYELTLESGDEVLARPTPSVEIGVPLSAALEHGDDIQPGTGAYRDRYVFQGQTGQSLEVRLNSHEIDPLLVLIGPAGEVLERDDDSGGGLNARIQTVLDETGQYVLYATSYNQATGVYSLHVDEYRAESVRPTAVEIGSQVDGTLGQSDARSARYGTLIDAFDVACRQMETITVSLSSAAFDSYLMIVDPNGETVAQDDDSGTALDARDTFECLMTGDYRILVTSTHYGTGAYQLSVTEGEFQPAESPAAE